MFIETSKMDEKLVLSRANYLVNIPVIDKFKDLVFFPGPELSVEVIKWAWNHFISFHVFFSVPVNSQFVAKMNQWTGLAATSRYHTWLAIIMCWCQVVLLTENLEFHTAKLSLLAWLKPILFGWNYSTLMYVNYSIIF